MNRKHTAASVTAVAVLAAITLSACSTPTTDNSDAEFVSGGTFTKALSSDPGSLIPMTAISLAAREFVSYAYENLAYVTSDGEIIPWLAESWEESGTEIVYTLKEGITCSDGTPFTAETAAANINYHADPANATFYYGSQVTEAISATGEGNTLTISSTKNDPFILANTGLIEMVCQAGLDDPDSLADATNGTGLFEMTDLVPATSYTFTKRTDYTWGPEEVTSETVGLPDTIEIDVITDESTAANLMLSGDVNAALITGPDKARLDGAGYDTVGILNPAGEMLFNEKSDRPTSDPLVREALSISLDRDEVGTVVTDGAPLESKSLVNKTPLLCVPVDGVLELPATDLTRAGELLDEAGWVAGADGKRSKDGEPLEITFIYDAATATHAAAAELVQQTWNELGITTELSANDAAAWSEQLFQTFDWDTGFVQIAPGSPVVLSNFFAGNSPDNGGNNFMFVENEAYNALAEEASSASPEETCGLWQEAEAELLKRFDVFPLAENIVPTYVSGAVIERTDIILPTAIRMVG